MEFACLAFRVYLLLCIFNGVQIPSGIFFQAIGKSTKSAILSLSRQILILIPAMVILSHMYGIMGVLSAGPVADGLAFILAAVLLIKQTRSLKEGKQEFEKNKESEEVKNEITTTPVVITIAREYGSGGRYIGSLVAKKLGIKLYDKEFIEKMSKDTGLSEDYIEDNEQKRSVLDVFNNGYYATLNNADELFIKESEFIKDVASKESCIIIGRCADFILKDNKNMLKVFVNNSMENKIKRAVEFYNIDKSSAEKEISRINKLRANHYKYYTEKEWRDPANYDICINSDAIGVERAAELICDIVNKNFLVGAKDK